MNILHGNRAYVGWARTAAFLAILLSAPLLIVVFGLFGPEGSAWKNLSETVLGSYVFETIRLVGLTALWSALLGVLLAWLVSSREFIGRRFLEWALILPLAIPTYLMAFTQAGMFGYTGLVRRLSLLVSAKGFYLDLLHPVWLSVILSLCLYPYVYVPLRLYFSGRLSRYYEAARSLGSAEWRIFCRILLPLSRPALAGGLFLVCMEVLNDYGAVKYFGVNTLTSGIFSAWLSMGDLASALRLSALLLLAVVLIMLMERGLRRGRFEEKAIAADLGSWRKSSFLAGAIAWVLFFLAFVLPMIQLVLDAFQTGVQDIRADLIELLWNSLGLALGTSIMVIVLSILMLYSQRLYGGRILSFLTRTATSGYAIPGAVIAVGVLVFTGRMDHWIGQLVLTGSIASLLFAYSVRFLAVGHNTLDGSFQQQVGQNDRAGLSLGGSPLHNLRRIVLPLVSRGVLAAAALVFVDVMKELPLTLILRPFNFHTFATRAYEYASDEMLARAAMPSLCIVLSGSLVLYLVHRFSRR